MRIEFNAPVTLTFAILCALVFLLGSFTDEQSTRLFFSIYRTSLFDPFMWVRLFTYILGHSSITHLFNNLVMILLLGPILEEKHGSGKILFMILVTAMISSLFNITFLSTGLLGASGIVFMFFMLSTFSNLRAKGDIPFTFLVLIVVFILEALYFYNDAELENFSHLAHIIGALCGAVFGYITEEPGYVNPKPAPHTRKKM